MYLWQTYALNLASFRNLMDGLTHSGIGKERFMVSR